jgi:hypothetical protein
MTMKIHGLRFYFMRAGSVRWLVAKEAAYGGRVTEPIRRVSPHDDRSPERLKAGCMVGGDRMSPRWHNYAPFYAKYLRPFIGRPVTLIEVGILRGTGLAIWSDLFPSGRVIGLDIDLSHFRDNEQNLRRANAYTANNVEVHEFDQFACNSDDLARILQGDRIDIFIDDGLHRSEPIKNTLKAVMPHLKQQCVCFIEDNETVADQLRPLARGFAVQSDGEMTVLARA